MVGGAFCVLGERFKRLGGWDIERMARLSALGLSKTEKPRPSPRGRFQERSLDAIIRDESAPGAYYWNVRSARIIESFYANIGAFRPERIKRLSQIDGVGRAERMKVNHPNPRVIFPASESHAAPNRRIINIRVGRRRIEHDKWQ